MHVQIILMSYHLKTYHIPSRSQAFSPGPEQLLLPGELLMYICLTKPQNTRKQNGNYGISNHDPEDAWAKLTCS